MAKETDNERIRPSDRSNHNAFREARAGDSLCYMCGSIFSSLVQGQMYNEDVSKSQQRTGNNERQNSCSDKQSESSVRKTSNTFRNADLQGEEMSIFKRLSNSLKMTFNKSCTFPGINDHSHERQKILEKLDSKIEQADQKREKIENRLNDVIATIDGDIEWMLYLDKRRKK